MGVTAELLGPMMEEAVESGELQFTILFPFLELLRPLMIPITWNSLIIPFMWVRKSIPLVQPRMETSLGPRIFLQALKFNFRPAPAIPAIPPTAAGKNGARPPMTSTALPPTVFFWNRPIPKPTGPGPTLRLQTGTSTATLTTLRMRKKKAQEI